MRTFLIVGIVVLTVTGRLWVAAVWALVTAVTFSRADNPRRRYAARNRRSTVNRPLLKTVPTRDVGLAMATVDVAARARCSWGRSSGACRSFVGKGRHAPT